MGRSCKDLPINNCCSNKVNEGELWTRAGSGKDAVWMLCVQLLRLYEVLFLIDITTELSNCHHSEVYYTVSPTRIAIGCCWRQSVWLKTRNTKKTTLVFSTHSGVFVACPVFDLPKLCHENTVHLWAWVKFVFLIKRSVFSARPNRDEFLCVLLEHRSWVKTSTSLDFYIHSNE